MDKPKLSFSDIRAHVELDLSEALEKAVVVVKRDGIELEDHVCLQSGDEIWANGVLWYVWYVERA